MSHLPNPSSSSSNETSPQKTPRAFSEFELFKNALRLWYIPLRSTDKDYKVADTYNEFLEDVHKHLHIGFRDIRHQLYNQMCMNFETERKGEILAENSENSPIKLPKEVHDWIHTDTDNCYPKIDVKMLHFPATKLPESEFSGDETGEELLKSDDSRRPYKTTAQNLRLNNPYFLEHPKNPTGQTRAEILERLKRFGEENDRILREMNQKKTGGRIRKEVTEKKKKMPKGIGYDEAYRCLAREKEGMDGLEELRKLREELEESEKCQKILDESLAKDEKIDDLEKRLKEKERENEELKASIRNMIVSDREAFKMEEKKMNSDRIDELTAQMEKLTKCVEKLMK
ncbi:hypothetical protein GCK72_015256 [Caenorhabditis remanei]|uniref:Uncharacterized protein n=1 Tax=Caenorhabditis remanei TaxID=31234 RepID=A0A6A5GW10_CAERE|nr:hypothetical protein GCK72_015256 [Caenorhabditis remanei]KAF1758796.1 hypothetical protein GCK72_015256 [Caenorhabditis remanei]